MIDGLSNAQQRAIHRMHRQGRTIESISWEWDIPIETIKTVIAHRDSLDEKNGVIRGYGNGL